MASDWQIDNTTITDSVAETRTAKRLTITWRTDRDTVVNQLRPLRTEAGKFETVVNENGKFSVIDISDSGIDHSLTPPNGRNTLRQSGTYYPADYRETQVDQASDKYEVTVEWQADAARETTSSSETAASDEWLFAFNSADIATKRLRYEATYEAPKGVTRTGLVAVLTESEAKVLEESAVYLDAVRIREFPDGPNTVVDNSENNRNQVTVTEPSGVSDSGDFLSGATYTVEGWETTWLNDSYFRIGFTLLN